MITVTIISFQDKLIREKRRKGSPTFLYVRLHPVVVYLASPNEFLLILQHDDREPRPRFTRRPWQHNNRDFDRGEKLQFYVSLKFPCYGLLASHMASGALVPLHP